MRKWMALLLIPFFAMAGGPTAEAYEGEVTIALRSEPPTMDPNVTSDAYGSMVWRWSYDMLVSPEPGTGKFLPWLATKWRKLSPKKVKFWLRKGVKFTDGTPFSAKAVKYTFERITDPETKSRQRVYFKALDRIEILDDHTVVWHNKVPDNGMFGRLTRFGNIISPTTKGMDRAITSRNTFGSGAYVLKAWTKGQRMVFEANPHWWGNRLYPNRPKTVTLRRIVEATTRVKALTTGEVDLIWGVPHHFIPEIEKNPKTRVVSVPSVRILFLGFFTRHGGPMSDRNVRLAINYAIDSEKIRETILGGRADPIGQILHPWNFSGHNPDMKWYGYDLEKAREYLKKSAYPKGFRAELIAPAGRAPGDKETCVAVAGMLGKIGVDAKCNASSFPLFRKYFTAYQKGKRKGAGMYFTGWGGSTGDTSLTLRGTTSCRGHWSGHCFQDLDAAIEKAIAVADPKKQQVAFEKVSEMMKEKATHKIFYKVHDVFGLRKGLEYRPRHDEAIFPWEIVMK